MVFLVNQVVTIENMEEEPQRVVVIVDASKDVSSKAVMKALQKTCPQAGDRVKLIAVLEELSSPSKFSNF